MTVFVDQQHSLLPLAALFASQALPAAGAFVAESAAVPRGTKYVTFWVTYTRGGAGGAPVFRASSRPSSASSWARVPLVDKGSFAAATPNASEDFYQEDHNGPAPADGDPVTYDLTFELPANANAVQLEVAELGAVGTPGTALVNWTGAGG